MVTANCASKQCGVDENVQFCEKVEFMMFVSGQINDESFRASGKMHAQPRLSDLAAMSFFISKQSVSLRRVYASQTEEQW